MDDKRKVCQKENSYWKAANGNANRNLTLLINNIIVIW
jgi:hypothetical protein